MTDRSKKAITRNPLLALPAALKIQALPRPAREALGALLLDLKRDSATRAEKAWRTHKAPMAAYWKAVAVYAGHTRKLCK